MSIHIINTDKDLVNTTQALGIQNSDAHKLLVTAMEPIVRSNHFSGEKIKKM